MRPLFSALVGAILAVVVLHVVAIAQEPPRPCAEERARLTERMRTAASNEDILAAFEPYSACILRAMPNPALIPTALPAPE